MTSPPSGSPRPNYDQALRELFAQAPAGVVEIFAPGLRWVAERSPNLVAAERRADIVWEVVGATAATGEEGADERVERGLLHIELQIRASGAIPQRTAEYGLRLYIRDGLPVYSLVIFLRPATTPEPVFRMRFRGQERMRYVFDVVRLWEVPQEVVLRTPYYALWPLAGLMADATVESVVAVAERIVQVAPSRDEQRQLTGLLTLLAGTRLPGLALIEALEKDRMIEDLLKESSFGEVMRALWRDELVGEGREKGLAEGEAIGRAEGEAEGLRRAAQQALEGRFGALDEGTLTALRTADGETCLAIVAHVTSDTLDQARARLGLSDGLSDSNE